MAFVGLVAACEVESGDDNLPIEPPTETPDTEEPENPETPDPENPEEPENPEPENPEEPEEPENPDPEEPRPEDAISTLEGDIEVEFPDECSLSYADCFGDYYSTGTYMWGFYFMNFTSKEQIYIEIMHPVHEYVIPEGTFTPSTNIYAESVFLKGDKDFEGYNVYSWYTALETDEHPAATAPIVDGVVTISANEDGTYRATFDLKDDAGNSITAIYDDRMIIEDFRI